MSPQIAAMRECANHCGRWLLNAVGRSVPDGALCAACTAKAKPL